MQLEAIRTYGRDSFSTPPERGVNGQASRATPMDPQLPSSRFLIGLTSAVSQALVASISSRDGTSGGSCSTSISVRYMQLPQLKGSGIHLHSLPSTPSLRGVFSLRFSCFYSNLTIRIAEFVACSSQSHLWVSSESSCRRPQESRWHRSQLYKRYATSYSRHQSEARDTLHRPTALGASEAMKDSRPSATDATSNQLQSLLGLRREVSLSLHEAKQEVCSLFSIDIMYVTFDIQSNEVHMYLTAPTAENKWEKDARHLYISSSLHPDSAPSLELRAFVVSNRDDFFRQDYLADAQLTMEYQQQGQNGGTNESLSDASADAIVNQHDPNRMQ